MHFCFLFNLSLPPFLPPLFLLSLWLSFSLPTINGLLCAHTHTYTPFHLLHLLLLLLLSSVFPWKLCRSLVVYLRVRLENSNVQRRKPPENRTYIVGTEKKNSKRMQPTGSSLLEENCHHSDILD